MLIKGFRSGAIIVDVRWLSSFLRAHGAKRFTFAATTANKKRGKSGTRMNVSFSTHVSVFFFILTNKFFDNHSYLVNNGVDSTITFMRFA